jgi:hypothetical protein
MSGHTEGPWCWDGKGGFIIEAPYDANRGQLVATVTESRELNPGEGPDERLLSEVWANARLIAAAPELLAALQRLVDDDFPDSDEWGAAEAAIKKATEGHS